MYYGRCRGQNQFEFPGPIVTINVGEAFLRKKTIEIWAQHIWIFTICNECYSKIPTNSLITGQSNNFILPIRNPYLPVFRLCRSPYHSRPEPRLIFTRLGMFTCFQLWCSFGPQVDKLRGLGGRRGDKLQHTNGFSWWAPPGLWSGIPTLQPSFPLKTRKW